MANRLSFVISFAFLICFCNPPLPEKSDIHFINWFVNADTNIRETLLASKPSIQELDSLASLIRLKKIKPGSHTTKCYDRDGTESILGFATPSHTVEDSLYPLIIYLHGGIGTTRTDKGEFAYEMFRFLADTIDLFLASPSGNRAVPWWTPAGLNRILKAVRYMTLHFPIDPDRIFLAGVSDGAAGCYAAANTICSPFAGFIAVSGFGGMLPRVGMELYPSNIMQRPMYNVHAGKDHLYPITVVQKFLDWLEEQGVSVKRKVYPDEEHGFEYRGKEREALAGIINTWCKPSRNNISWIISEKVPNRSDNLLSWAVCSNSEKSSINILCYWKHDTLIVRSQGLCSFSLISNKKKNSKLFYKTENGTVKALKLQEPDTEQYLALMQHFCTPKVRDVGIGSIDLD